jgi:hypothetical protein
VEDEVPALRPRLSKSRSRDSSTDAWCGSLSEAGCRSSACVQEAANALADWLCHQEVASKWQHRASHHSNALVPSPRSPIATLDVTRSTDHRLSERLRLNRNALIHDCRSAILIGKHDGRASSSQTNAGSANQLQRLEQSEGPPQRS